MTPEYADRLELGKEFQDHVMPRLLRYGILFQPYSSRKYQIEHGESPGEIELKLDRLFRATGNLFVEIEERPSSETNYKPAGIYHPHKPWLYIIGDLATVFVFMTWVLRWLHQKGEFETRDNDQQRARGFLLPVDRARLYAKECNISD